MKLCTKCKIEKTAQDFPADARLKTELNSQCRACHAIRSRSFYEKNKATVQARSRAWMAAHPERTRELARKRRPKISDAEWQKRKAATKERTRASVRRSQSVRWHTDPSYRESRRLYQTAYRAAKRLAADIARILTEGVRLKRTHHKICPLVRLYPELLADAKAAARLERQARRDPAKIKASLQNWRQRHPAAVSAQRFRRRVNFQNAVPIDLTETQWTAIKAAYGHRCAYCGRRKPLTQDHVVPISKGGAHTAGNIVPACQSCNSSKGVRVPSVTYQPHLIA
jgi:5-methylcytosine-specific restriction endonuclease McrA